MSRERIFIFGMGYTASAFARALGDRAEWIRGTTRAGDNGTRRFDGAVADPLIVGDIAEATALVVSVPPGEADPVLAHFADAIGAAPQLRWIAYLSTVGVYGNYAGAWVSERSTPHPATERARARLKAEREWTALAARKNVPLATLRLAGIYGPGRNAFVSLSEGRAHRVVKPGQVFNRIHVDDIAAAMIAALERHAAGIFNLADDLPAPPEDVIASAAKIMAVAAPPEVPFDKAELTPMARSFYAGNARIVNRKAKAELGLVLRYPTYREGLAVLWRDGNWKSSRF